VLSQILQLTRPLIILDYETTGIDPEVARVCQIGMRIHLPGTPRVDTYQSLVDPCVPIRRESSDVHKITDEMIKEGCAKCRAPIALHPIGLCSTPKPVPRFADIADSLYRGFQDADFAGYHVRFDLRVSIAEFRRCGIEFDPSTAAIIDAQRAWQLLEPRTLSDAHEHFLHRKMPGAHDALADVEGTEAVLIAELTEHPRSTELPRSVRELHEMMWPRDKNQIDSEKKFVFVDGVPTFNFGAHKGKAMVSQTGYLKWMAEKGGFSPEVKKICRAALDGTFPVQTP